MLRRRICNCDLLQLQSKKSTRLFTHVLPFAIFLPMALAAQSVSIPDVIQFNRFKTGLEGSRQLMIPSTDPAGITYHAPSGHLFIADSEIEEISDVWEQVQANVFEASLDGKILYESYNLVDEATTGVINKEPAGIAYSDFDGFFYLVNDDTHLLYRYERLRRSDRHILYARDWVDVSQLSETADMKGDLEGVAVDPVTGWIYVVDGFDAEIAIFRYTTGFEFIGRIPVLAGDGKRFRDPEGIAIHPIDRHIFVTFSRKSMFAELTITGQFLRVYSDSNLNPSQMAMQGLTFGPSSYTAISERGQPILYIADGRSDNAAGEIERDGIIYEVFATPDKKEAERQRLELERKYSLLQNYPNPFNANTTISFFLLEDANVNIKLLDIRGQEIMTIVDGFYSVGQHEVLFESDILSSGVYYYKMYARGSAQTRRLILLK